MTSNWAPAARRRRLLGAVPVVGLVALLVANVTSAAEATVGLGTATSFAVLAGAGVTNTGPSVLNGDLGTCPTPTITQFPPGMVNGTVHADDAVACQAKSDLVVAYDDAASRAPTTTFPGPTDLVGKTLTSGVYNSPSSLALTDTLTLDAQGDQNAVFIFQAASTLITAPNSTVALINGAQACNVFWQIGSSATLGVGSMFVGTILALTAISAKTNADIQGRLLARNASVTLDTNTITAPRCAPPTTTTTGATTTTTGATTTTTGATTTTTGATTTTTTGATTTTTGATTTTTGGATTTTTGGGATTTTTGATTTTTGGGATTTTTSGAGGSATTTSEVATTTTAGGGLPGSGTTTSTTSTPLTTSTTTMVQTGTTSSTTTTAAATPESAGGTGLTAAGVASNQILARTGSPTTKPLTLAALLMALGGALLVVGRRRRRASAGA